MRTALTRTAVFVALLVPLACAEAHTPAPPPRTVPPVVVFGLGYTWGQTSDPFAGVRVRVHRPVSVAAGGRRLDGMRELAVEIDVFNSSRGDVRVGVSGSIGKYEAVPKLEEQQPVITRDSTGTVHRAVFVPVEAGPAVVHVAATVDGRAVAQGWRYVGPIDT
ncbi:hypothetical protein [Lentzea kentuckyensis]|uniref:hypothetical protein n=1 Tax=Lentzea kentuckyensis TaxID=360086 RepID=UPI000A3B9EE4|nr:hypothetical protein [Lentzea kentuckyensis]